MTSDAAVEAMAEALLKARGVSRSNIEQDKKIGTFPWLEALKEARAALAAALPHIRKEVVEECARYHDEAADVLARDADLAARVGCNVFDSGGTLDYYAELHRGHAQAIRALAQDGDAK